jgi:ribosome-associated heat shock protein Hsp15
MTGETPDDRVRIDKWLWAARFFKTRSLATDAVTGGKVEVNGEGAKPAKLVKIGDTVRLRLGPYEHMLVIRALGERRGSATAAQALYDETPESRAARERLAEQHRLARAGMSFDEPTKPSKRDRRDIERLRRRG